MGDAWLASFTTDPDAMRGLFDTYQAALPPGKELEMPICQEYFLGASDMYALDKCRENLINKYAPGTTTMSRRISLSRSDSTNSKRTVSQLGTPLT
jgi:hypothetical protein